MDFNLSSFYKNITIMNLYTLLHSINICFIRMIRLELQLGKDMENKFPNHVFYIKLRSTF